HDPAAEQRLQLVRPLARREAGQQAAQARRRALAPPGAVELVERQADAPAGCVEPLPLLAEQQAPAIFRPDHDTASAAATPARSASAHLASTSGAWSSRRSISEEWTDRTVPRNRSRAAGESTSNASRRAGRRSRKPRSSSSSKRATSRP